MQHSKCLSPTQVFAKMMVNINKKHWKPFGCPVYMLDESLQTGEPFNKWKQCSRVGIYLGQSPIHNRNIALVLNQNTGHVSPQFQVKFNSSFHSMQQDQLDCTWQQSTFFTAPSKHTNKRKQEKGTHLSEGAHKIPRLLRLQTTDGSSNNARSDPLQQQRHDEVPQQANDGTPSENANAGTLVTGQPLPQQQQGQREVDGPPQTNIRTHSDDLHRSKHTSKPPHWLIEVMKIEIAKLTIPGELFSLTTVFPADDIMDQPHSAFYCYKGADSDPDTMYHQQAMQQPDR